MLLSLPALRIVCVLCRTLLSYHPPHNSAEEVTRVSCCDECRKHAKIKHQK